MAFTLAAHGFDPEDPDRPLRLAVPDASAPGGAEPSPWVEPDYSTVADATALVGPGPFRDWPGPPLVMPAGLLPDGKPFGNDDRENALRIEGRVPFDDAQADAVVWAYRAQQHLLRGELGLPRPERPPPSYALQDTDDTRAAIAEVHLHERDRRRGLAC